MKQARELLQRAQEVELGGDTAAAVELLLQAADLYEDAGSPARALKLLRHALRLDGGREEVSRRMRRLEAHLPPEPEAVSPQSAGEEEPLPQLEGSEALEVAAREALAHLEQRERAGDGEPSPAPRRAREAAGTPVLVERGPTLADPALEAWCSFCCRPGREVGALVAGPAGAYVCGACAGAAVRLLGHGVVGRSQETALPGPLTPALSHEEGEVLFGREAVLAAVAGARRLGARCLLLVGPEGAGRSTCLAALAQAAGATVVTPATSALPPTGPLFVDDVEALPEALVRALDVRLREAPGREVLLVARGQPQPAPHVLEGEGGRVPLWTSAALRALAPGLPAVLAEHVQQLIPVAPPAPGEAERLCEHLLARLRPDVHAGPGLVAWLAAEALRAPRLLHELVALVRRLPAGYWRGAPAVPPEESLP